MNRTSTEAYAYMRRHQGAKVEHFDVSIVIYHKYSHGGVCYTLNGENVNDMLEFKMTLTEPGDPKYRIIINIIIATAQQYI